MWLYLVDFLYTGHSPVCACITSSTIFKSSTYLSSDCSSSSMYPCLFFSWGLDESWLFGSAHHAEEEEYTRGGSVLLVQKIQPMWPFQQNHKPLLKPLWHFRAVFAASCWLFRHGPNNIYTPDCTLMKPPENRRKTKGKKRRNGKRNMKDHINIHTLTWHRLSINPLWGFHTNWVLLSNWSFSFLIVSEFTLIICLIPKV